MLDQKIHEEHNFLEALSIAYFRGFLSEQVVEFAHPNGTLGSGLTIIIGENNSGKTTILTALANFEERYGTLETDEKHHNELTRICLKDCKGDSFDWIYKKRNKWGVKETVDNTLFSVSPYHIRYLSSRRIWEDEFELYDEDVKDKNYHYEVTERIYKADRGSYASSILNDEFGKILAAIYEQKETRDAFNKAVRGFIPHFYSWTISRKSRDKYIFTYKTKNKIQHRGSYLGGGVINLIKILSIFFINSSDHIVLIDEPELGLHPQIQKKLANFLSEKSKEMQIIIATHSPYFVNWEDLKNGANIARVFKDSSGQVSLANLNRDFEPLKTIINEDWKKPYQLDVVAKEYFFANKVVFVEGQEDKSLLEKLCTEERIPLNFEFYGYGVGGFSKIRSYLAISKHLGIKAGAFFDKGGDGDKYYDELVEEYGKEFYLRKNIKEDIRDKENVEIKDGIAEIKYIKGDFKEGIVKPRSKKRLLKYIQGFNKFFLK